MFPKMGMKKTSKKLMREFVREALAADAAVEKGAAVYRAEDVHAWLDRRAHNREAVRPKPWRG